ncbi:hypothetical protein [Candidatus Poriferisodalis sp.]|uniref:hypothetical protein n=1 Tax=Candidatus Poriferisodalis sp. TaxID=3101277 RepID=UPI003B523C85
MRSREIRRHELSPEAAAYKARRKPSVPVRMPDLADFAAVARWRTETNALWGTDDDAAVPHRQGTIGGVPGARKQRNARWAHRRFGGGSARAQRCGYCRR